MPAPSRYVVTRPGAVSDPSASMSLSDWIQPTEQTADTGELVYAEAPTDTLPATAGGVDVVADEPTPMELYPVDLFELATALLSPFEGIPAHAGTTVQLEHEGWTRVSGTIEGDDDPFYFEHTLRGFRGGARRTPCVRLADTVWRDAWRPEWPPEAVGYEVEQVEVASSVWGAFAEPTRLDMAVSVQPSVYHGIHGSGLVVQAALNDNWGGGPLTFDVSGGLVSDGTPPGITADFVHGQILHPVQESGVLLTPEVYEFTITDFAVPYTGLVGLQYAVTAFPGATVEVYVGDNGFIEINPGVTYSGVYTIRPPRIRWIYDVPPIRQTSHRDDHLAGGAYQTWPAPTSDQMSNTTFGGYL